jgi:hypothetical protein
MNNKIKPGTLFKIMPYPKGATIILGPEDWRLRRIKNKVGKFVMYIKTSRGSLDSLKKNYGFYTHTFLNPEGEKFLCSSRLNIKDFIEDKYWLEEVIL